MKRASSKDLGRFFYTGHLTSLVLGMFAYWRIAIFENVEGVTRNTPVILNQVFSEPFKAVGFLLTASVKDAASVMTIGWQNAMSADMLDFNSVFARYRLLISAVSFVAAFIYLSKFRTQYDEDNPSDDWSKGSVLLAVTGLMVGGLPVWLIGRYILESKNLLSASRFGLPSMFGAAFLLILIIDYFISDRKKKFIMFSLCIALAVNFHLDNTKEFQNSWEKQVRLAQQLALARTADRIRHSHSDRRGSAGNHGRVCCLIFHQHNLSGLKILRTPPLLVFPILLHQSQCE